MRRLSAVVLFLILSGCGGGGKNVEVNVPNDLHEPDRVLYEQAIKDLGKSRYNIARLTLQTLINTYPDSEFLPEAKYALAESFYREGTTSNLNQAELEFKDFITFFPTSERADDAQLMIAMTHVRQMQKPDRDPSQAELAESELRNTIENYPDSPLLDEAKQKLRAVQEVLAEGEFKIGNQYFIRKAYGASISRYREVVDKYPDYSKIPEVLFFLAESLRHADNPESAIYYAKILTDYPFSDRTAEAKTHLTELNKPIPEPNPAALARGEQQAAKEKKGLLGSMFGGLARRPDIPLETGASSVRDNPEKSDDKSDSEDKPEDNKSKPKRKDNDNNGGSLRIENKPVKKPK